MNNYIKFLAGYGLQTVYSKSSLTQDSTKTTESFTLSSNNGYNTSLGLAPIAQRKNQIETIYKTGTYGSQYIRKLDLDTGTTSESSYATVGTWKYKNVNNVMFMFSYYTYQYNPSNYAFCKIDNSYTQMTFTFYDVKYYKGVYYFFTGSDIVTSTDLITFTNHNLNLNVSNIKTFDVLQDKIYLFRTASGSLNVDIYDLTFTFIETKTIMSNGYYMWYAEHLEENNYIYASLFGNSQMKIIRYNISDNTYDLTTLYVLGSTSNDTIGAHYYDTVVNYATKTYSVYSGKNGVTVDSSFNESLIEPSDNGNSYIYEAVVKYMKVDITGRATLHDENTYNNLNGYKYKTVDSSPFTFRIKPNTNYKIDQVTSTIAGVSIVQDGQDYIVTYPDVYYQEDTLDVETSFAISLEPKGYKVKDTYTLTESFTSMDTTNDNFAVVEDNGENKIAPFKAIRFISDNVELKVNDEWSSFDKILYLGISEYVFGITNEFLTIFNKNYDYFYKGITFEYTSNLENLNVSLSGQYSDVAHVDYDLETDSEVDSYVAFMENTSSKLFFNLNVDEGYKIVTIDANVGTYTTIYNPRVEVTQAEMIQNLNAQFDITLDADDFKVILYKCTSESNAMNKYLSEPLELNCNLVEGTSVQNPSILFELSLLPPDYNYAYIPIFKRYYFIGNKINVGFKLWRFNLDVDVLESAKNVIKNANAYVLRSSKYGSDYLFDELKPHYDTLTYTKLSTTNYRSFDFKPNSPSFNIIVVLRSTKSIKTKYNSELEVTTYPSDYITYGAWQENESGTDTKISDASVSDTSDLVFLATAKGWETLLDYLNEESLQSYIKNVIVYPYGDATNLFHSVASSVDEFTINFDDNHSKVLSSALVKRPLGLPKKLLFATYDFDGLESKLYKQNYKYALYLPFFGYTELDKNKLVHSKLFVYYYLDLASGISNVSLEVKKTNSTKATLLINQQCSLGIRIGFDIDNEAEVQKQRDMIQQQQTTNNITSALSLIGSLASVIGGAVATATGVGAGLGVAGIVGGISGLASSGTSLVSKNIQAEKQLANLFSTASSIIGTGNSSLYIDNEIALYEVTNDMVLTNDSETSFIARNGKPTKQYMSLSGLTGYFLLGDIDLSGLTNLTSGEISALRNILYSGFYIK